MTSRTIRRACATLALFGLASVSILAQGSGGLSGAPVQAVGTLLVDGIAEQPTPIYQFGLAVTNAVTIGSGGGAGAGKAEFTNVHVSRLADASSPQLFRAAVLGIHISSVHINLSKSAGAAASSYVLRDAIVTGFSNTDGLEQVAFAFKSVEVTAGGVTTCFDLSTNSGC